jgi:hypothetical protein
MASIYKMDSKKKGGKPTYWVITTINGKQKWHKAGFKEKDAKRLRSKLETQIDEGLLTAKKKQPWRNL